MLPRRHCLKAQKKNRTRDEARKEALKVIEDWMAAQRSARTKGRKTLAPKGMQDETQQGVESNEEEC